MSTGYFPPGSITRRVIGDPAALIGGFSALFVQALHPRAMAGIDQHSTFPDDFSGPYFAGVRPELVASPIARRAARRLAPAPIPRRIPLPVPVGPLGEMAASLAIARPAWTAVAAVAIGLLPPWAKRLYGIPRVPEIATTAGLAALRAAFLGVRRATGRPAPPR